MPKKSTGQTISTQYSDLPSGTSIAVCREERGMSSAYTSSFSSSGALLVRVDKHSSVGFTYDSDVMARRRANVRANRAPVQVDTTD